MIHITEDGAGVQIGGRAETTVGFHGVTKRPQRKGAVQGAVTGTAAASIDGTAAQTSAYGFTEAQANELITAVNAMLVDQAAMLALLNEVQATLAEKGIFKGSA